MSRKLSSDEKNLVLDNQGLVHFLVRSFGIDPISSEYDDFVSIGNFGLIKAATTFDSSRNIKFSSYASTCIKNKIFDYYKNAKKYSNDISIYEFTENCEKFILDCNISNHNSDFVQTVEDKEVFIKLVNIILNYLEGKRRLAILYEIADLPQKYIAKILNISKSYVSKIIKETINEIRNIFDSELCYKEIFSMDIVGDEYIISFFTKDIIRFNNIFESFLKNMSLDTKLTDFKVNYTNEQVAVYLPESSESFYFIAQVIKKIDDFSISYISDNSKLQKDSSVLSKVI